MCRIALTCSFIALSYFAASYSFINIHQQTQVTQLSHVKQKFKFKNIHARIKKRTNSKRSLDLDDDNDSSIDDTLISEDVSIAIQQARSKLNSFKVRVQTPSISSTPTMEESEDDNDNDDDDDEEDVEMEVESYFEEPVVTSIDKMDTKTWKATVQSMIKTKLQQKFNISHVSDIPDSSSISNLEPPSAAVVTDGLQQPSIADDTTNTTSTTPTVNKSRLIKLSIIANRIEVIVSNGAYDDGELREYDAEQLRDIHKDIYDMFEAHDVQYNNTKYVLDVVARYEIMVATPGISDVLRFDRDFVSFQGFKVFVTTNEEINHKSVFEGTLVGRSTDMVTISLKGRKMNIPRNIVKDVWLPKAKTEPTDNEIRKLVL